MSGYCSSDEYNERNANALERIADAFERIADRSGAGKTHHKTGEIVNGIRREGPSQSEKTDRTERK